MQIEIFFRYKLPPPVHHRSGGKLKTKQEAARQCDINRLVDRYVKGGCIDNHRKNLGIYADVSGIPDLQTSLQFLIKAKDSFNRLDSSIRNRFHDNPQELLAFLSDPKNYEEGQELGFFKKTQSKIIPPSEEKIKTITNPEVKDNKVIK